MFVLVLSLIAVVDENCCCCSSVKAEVMLFRGAGVKDFVVVIVSFVVAAVVGLFLQLSSSGSQSIFRL